MNKGLVISTSRSFNVPVNKLLSINYTSSSFYSIVIEFYSSADIKLSIQSTFLQSYTIGLFFKNSPIQWSCLQTSSSLSLLPILLISFIRYYFSILQQRSPQRLLQCSFIKKTFPTHAIAQANDFIAYCGRMPRQLSSIHFCSALYSYKTVENLHNSF